MASPNEQLLFAAKTDSSELLQQILQSDPETFDVNFQDGLGNTALHYAAQAPSPTALELLLEFDGTDVDLQNRLEGATPLHLAVKIEHEGARQGVVDMLLEAGADPRIKDKTGTLPVEYLHPDSNDTDREIQRAIAIATAELTIGGVDSADVADDDDDGEPGSGSGSDED
ncbi:ankyrin [Meredithblackwellia eburnea MCA 4105]